MQTGVLWIDWRAVHKEGSLNFQSFLIVFSLVFLVLFSSKFIHLSWNFFQIKILLPLPPRCCLQTAPSSTAPTQLTQSIWIEKTHLYLHKTVEANRIQMLSPFPIANRFSISQFRRELFLFIKTFFAFFLSRQPYVDQGWGENIFRFSCMHWHRELGRREGGKL
jgi:hypothetical protein